MSSSDRQRIEKVAGRRRARLTAAPGTGSEPVDSDALAPSPETGWAAGPNDERMRQDVPPHY